MVYSCGLFNNTYRIHNENKTRKTKTLHIFLIFLLRIGYVARHRLNTFYIGPFVLNISLDIWGYMGINDVIELCINYAAVLKVGLY